MATASTGAARKSGPKVLRVGIIQNGRPIEERLFRKRQGITIGQTPKQTFCIPVSAVPKSFSLFEVKGDSYVLRFSDQMGGRVSLGDGVHDVKSLKASGKAQRQGDAFVVRLNERSRGKITLGDVTVLFQFVVPPPPKPQLPLPPAMRGGLLGDMDWNFVLIMFLSAVVHISTVAWLENTDWPEPRDVGIGLPDRFVEILKPPVKEPEKTDEKLELDKGEETASDEAPKDEPKPKKVAAKPKPNPNRNKPVDPDTAAKALANKKKALAAKVENKTILKQLGTIGGEGAPSLVDSLRGGASRKSLDEAFAGSTGVAAATSDEERSGLRRSGSAKATGTGKTAGIGNLGGVKGAKEAGAVAAKTGTKREGPKVKARLRAGGERVVGSGVVDKNKVASVIRRRQGAIIGCYERELKKNPSLKGKIVVRFTIGTAGRVTSASIASNTLNGAVGSCVTSRIKSWRFPKPDGGSVSVSKSFVFSPSN